MTPWNRSRLRAALAEAQADNAKLRARLTELASHNEALRRQLAEARPINTALQGHNQQLRNQLDTYKRDPLHDQLRAAQRHAADLEQRLHELTCKSRALDTTPQGWSTR